MGTADLLEQRVEMVNIIMFINQKVYILTKFIFQKSALLVLVVILGCNGQGYQGYFYPKPSVPLEPAPVCSTSYLTQTLRETVPVPVYYTSTVVDQQYITVYSTVIQPVTQIQTQIRTQIQTQIQTLIQTQTQTQTRTVVITPSPVTFYSTIVSTVTALSGIQVDSSSNQQSALGGIQDDSSSYQQSVNNGYLPPPPVVSVSDDARGNLFNEYLPPPGEDARSNRGVNILSDTGADSYSVRFNPFEQQQLSLNLGALPPY